MSILIAMPAVFIASLSYMPLEVEFVDLPPKNWSSYNVRKKKPVKRGVDG